jgi:hypothetical protein
VTRRLARSALAAAATRWPTATYSGIGAVARVTRPRRSSEWKSRALGVVMATATAEPVFPAIRVIGAVPGTTQPVIFISLHAGALAAIGALFQRMPRRVAALHRMEWRLPSNVESIYVAPTDEGGAAGFRRALELVRGGDHAFMPIDGHGIDVPLLDRATSFSRGPFALARLTGAPIVPLVAQWRGGRVDIFVGEAVAAGDDEEEMALAVADGLDRHLRAHPSEIPDWLIRRPRQPAP